MYLLSSCNSTQSPFSNSSNVHVAKRARPLPQSHSDDEFDGNLFTQNDSEREFASKAKRLIRFKDDMIEDAMPMRANKSSGHLSAERDMKTAAHNGNVLHEYCMFESEYAVVGLCLDMCPESERAERERKGDLDPYERFNGDSKQTTEFIAVKKYSRTAPRDAHLIRPMPVLHKTINHLLSLLDRSYDDQFLGVYNFLWDRMRAVRMDLRMQHIFNNEAITMLEQMIKLHIIAMHELCEFSKGEGFVEGFDAHLNIEQMNKTSVELFEMYDNYNKKGKHLETEREFRGYYALLKLDRHPGYNVEPQELSLDLSKMSPEMRSTPEVLFARNVTRACRTCNFVAFFKLVRKSSYLQACLMHAHFVKLRTYGLASLHSGLQNNQGIPVSHVAMWLGMEKENMSDLLSFHGFVIKNYKEPYMIKEGPFLNSETDYPTKHSKLVHMKRSKTVVDDVSFSFLPAATAAEKIAEINSVMLETTNYVEIHNETPIDEEMSDTGYEFLSSPRGDNTQQQQDMCEGTPSYEDELKFYMDQEVDNRIPENVASQNSLLTPAYCYQSICVSFPQISAEEGEIPSIEVPEEDDENRGSHTEEESCISSTIVAEVKCGEVENDFSKSGENEALVSDRSDRADGNAKLRSILRLWRNKASNRKELQNRRLLAANEALNFLSLGPPMGKRIEDVDFHSDFTMDDLFFELQKKHDQKPFTTMNLSEIVSGELCRRDPEADFISWRVALCCSGDRSSALGSWILSILIPDERPDSHSFVSSSSEISIWKKSVHRHDGTGPARCFSVVRKIDPDEPAEVLAGADSLLTTLCKTLPLDLQKTRICSMLASCTSPLPPILILTDLSSASAVLEEALNLFYGTKRILKCRILVISGKAEDYKDLSDALRWLAGRVAPKLGVRAVKTRDLVMRHLNTELRALSHIDNVSPDRCVQAVNRAVDRSVEEIYSASLRSLRWPSPELDALFPGAVLKTERVFRSLEMCRLPCFPDVREVSRRSFGSACGMDRSLSELRILLTGYLGVVMGTDMAAKEADLLLQKHTVLELCDEGRRHRLVPKWVPIFRRIFNWSLAPLSHFKYGSDVALVVGGLVDPLFGLERGEEACFFEAEDPWIGEVAAGMGWKNDEENEVGREEETCGEVVLLSGEDEIGGYRGGDDDEGVEGKSDGADEFNRLLDKCEVMQNIIDQKLSLFF